MPRVMVESTYLYLDVMEFSDFHRLRLTWLQRFLLKD